MESVLGTARDSIVSLAEPFEDIWGLYQGLDPEQQRVVLFLLPVVLLGLIGWGMYQTHGDRVLIVLPAMLARYGRNARLLNNATP